MAGDEAARVRLILAQAPVLQAQGRWQTLERWIDSVPAHTVESAPWLLFWRGACAALTDPHCGRTILERAFEAFARHQDALGQALAAAAIIDTYFFEWAQFKSLDCWIEVLQNFLSADAVLPYRQLELRVLASTGLAILYRQPKNPFLHECVNRIQVLVFSNIGPNEKISATVFLFHYYAIFGDLDQAQPVLIATQSQIADDRVTPINRLWLCNWLAYLNLRAGKRMKTLALLDQQDSIVREYGLGFLEHFVVMCRACALLTFGEPNPAEVLIKSVEERLDYLQTQHVTFFLHLRSMLALSRNDLHAALSDAQRAIEQSSEAGEAIWFPLFSEALAVVRARLGEHQAALGRLREATGNHPEDNPVVRHSTLLLEAYLAHMRGDQFACLDYLKQGIALGAARDYRNSQHWMPGMMATLCGLALRHRIQVEYVRDIIQCLALKPESPDIEHWPWPIKFYTLGRFSLLVDDAPIEFVRKAPKKPIALLKFIVATGGRQVPIVRAIDALWPDEEGDSAQKSFQITLHRLRKLLQHPDAVQLQEGRLSLNAALCWVDAWTFERLAVKAAAASDSLREEHPESLVRALTLYEGNFLANDLEAPWTLSRRERLRIRYIRLIALQASRLIETGDVEAAIACYWQGITADELAEEFYLGLMRCYQQLARPAEGLAAYQRLSRMVSVKLGVKPSPASQALAKTLRAS